jgi:hypothetical protein
MRVQGDIDDWPFFPFGLLEFFSEEVIEVEPRAISRAVATREERVGEIRPRRVGGLLEVAPMQVGDKIAFAEVITAWAEAERGSIANVSGVPLPQSPSQEDYVSGLQRGRGYPDGFIFRGWPHDAEWFRARATVGEIGRFAHLSYPTFNELSGGSRAPVDCAKNLDEVYVEEDLNRIAKEIGETLRKGTDTEPIIVLAPDRESRPIIAEGNKRSIGYQLALPSEQEVEFFLGISPSVTDWAFFGL